MSEMAARYDRRAPIYDRCWAPVLRSPGLALLDLVAAEAARPRASILDVGTGTGTLAIAAALRFPGARITGLDVSAGMLEQARAAAARETADPSRIVFVEAAIAEAVGDGVPPDTFDVAVSAFVLQLVPDRAAALAAILRALRPGGRLAYVTWADNAKPASVVAAWERALADALAEAGLPTPEIPEPPRSGPIPDPARAVAELRAAGFVDATATRPPMVHDFGRAGARAVMVEFDGAPLLDALPGRVRAGVVRRFDDALARLADEAFVWRPSIVTATARRPA